jgi:NDP-mannose synthase
MLAFLQTKPCAGDAAIGPRERRALVMAGGRSERMRATFGIHKALVPVCGASLLERSLLALFEQEFVDVVIAVARDSHDIESFVAERGRELGSPFDARLTCFREPVPLGTIGAARVAAGDADALLVVNVDNISTLPLRALVEHHRRAGAALTIASHQEPFRIPFGQLIVADGLVQEYREKPTMPIVISSGTYVLGHNAVALIPPDTRFDVTDLFRVVRAAGLQVAAFEHQSPWIDVNDEPALRRAEEMVSALSSAVNGAT